MSQQATHREVDAEAAPAPDALGGKIKRSFFGDWEPRQQAGAVEHPTAEAETTDTATARPGWYPQGGRFRWWDGTAWTNQWRNKRERWSRAAEVGMWLALFLPIVGFFMGLALVAGRDPHGHWVVLTSVAVPILVVILLAS